MKRSLISSRLASLAAGLLAGSVLGSGPAAKSQGVVTVNYGGVVNSGNTLAFGTPVSGTISYNPNQFYWSSSANEFIDPNGVATETVNGQTTTFTGLEAFVAIGALDSHIHPSDQLFLSWGDNGLDGVDVTDPAGTVSANSINSIDTMVGLGLSVAVQYGNAYKDNGFVVGSNASATEGAQGYLTDFAVVATPEPSTWALGGLGGAALAAARLRSGLKRRSQQKTVSLPAGR